MKLVEGKIIIGLSLFVGRTSDKKYKEIFVFVFILICIITYIIFLKNSLNEQEKVLNGEKDIVASFETEYGSIKIIISNIKLIRFH